MVLIALLIIAFMINTEIAARTDAHTEYENTQEITQPSTPVLKPEPRPDQSKHGTSLKSPQPISEEKLRAYLASLTGPGTVGSPLASHATQLVASEYVGTIVGICAIEQYNCTRAPYHNYWGIMKPGGGLKRYGSLEEGIADIHAHLARRESQGLTTIESLRGRYCVDKRYPGAVCPNWEPYVKRIKAQVEALTLEPAK